MSAYRGLHGNCPAFRKRPVKPRQHCKISATTLDFAVSAHSLFVVPGFRRVRGRRLTPWIVVDRPRRLINLPRSNTNISFSNVVRLQLVSCAPLGFSQRTLSYRGKPNSGELQIVFIDHSAGADVVHS